MKYAEINSNVMVNLGFPNTELLAMYDVHQSVKNRASLRTQQLQFSDQNQIISSDTFTTSSRIFDITSYINQGTEAWIEQRIDDFDTWKPLEVVNLAYLERAGSEGRFACAFYGDENGFRYVKFSFQPADAYTFRLWYDPANITNYGANDASRLPDTLNTLIELESSFDCCGKIISRLARNIESDEQRPLINLQVQGWKELQAGFAAQIPQWEKLYDQWAFRSKGAQVSGELPRKFIRSPYR